MTLTLLNPRDEGPNIHFRLSFYISFGLPSRILCTLGTTTIYSGEGIVSGLNYEIVRYLYASSSQPDVTRVSFEQVKARTGAPYMYSCTVTVLGRINIASGSSGGYNYDVLGSATSTAPVTGE